MKRICSIIAVVSIGTNIWLFTNPMIQSSVSASLFSSYHLLSPRIFTQKKNDIIINFTDLREELRSTILRPKGFEAGVYFGYLPSGVSIGINEKREFISASLLKTPLILGIFKEIENGHIDLRTNITLETSDLDSRFGTLWKRGAGAGISIEDAIYLGLTQSDNTAINVLNRQMDRNILQEVHDALDIPLALTAEPTVNAKNYSSIFRCLYLSCYTQTKHSQKILSLLTQTIYVNGLPARLPPHVPVAHKIGIHDHPNHDGGVRSDCGIVYVPRRPYILCILMEGNKEQEKNMIDFMQDISKRVYDFVSSRD